MSTAPFMTPGAGRVRTLIERRSAFLIIWLSQLPRLAPPVLIVALFLAGVLSSGFVSLLVLLVLVAFMSLLSYLSWPALAPAQRTIRAVVLVALTAFAVSRVL